MHNFRSFYEAAMVLENTKLEKIAHFGKTICIYTDITEMDP